MGTNSSKSQITHVVAVDLGTTRSGYMYARSKDMKPEFGKGFSKVDSRIPSRILYDRLMQKALYFGNEATKKYEEYIGEMRGNLEALGSHNHQQLKDFHILDNMKGQILPHTKDIKTMSLFTIDDKQVDAVQAFSSFLEYLKKECIKEVDLVNDETFWVINVPATSQKEHRDFMELAADMARIKMSGGALKFSLITESESSAEFCRQLHKDRFLNPASADGHEQKTNYIVLDYGGGTADASFVATSKEKGIVTSTHVSTSGASGGDDVNKRFQLFVQGQSKPLKQFVDSFQAGLSACARLKKEFNELKARPTTSQTHKPILLRVGEGLDKSFEELTKSSLESFLEKYENLTYDGKHFCIKFEGATWERNTVDDFLNEIQEIFENQNKAKEWKKLDMEYKYQVKKAGSADCDLIIPVPESVSKAFKEMQNKELKDYVNEKSKLTHISYKEGIEIQGNVRNRNAYDKCIDEINVTLSRYAQMRLALWNVVCSEFEEGKKSFDGKHDISFSMENFAKGYKSLTGKIFKYEVMDHCSDDDDKLFQMRKDNKNDDVTFLKIKSETAREELFDPVLKKVVEMLKSHDKKKDVQNKFQLLYLVGGFGQCPYVKIYLEKYYTRKREIAVLVPEEGITSVLKGSIAYAYSKITTYECTIRHNIYISGNSKPVCLAEKNQEFRVSDFCPTSVTPKTIDEKYVLDVYCSKRDRANQANRKTLGTLYCKEDQPHDVALSCTDQHIRLNVRQEDGQFTQVIYVPKDNIDDKLCTLL